MVSKNLFVHVAVILSKVKITSNNTPYSMGFDPPEVEKWLLCLNIVVPLPPKPPWLDCYYFISGIEFSGALI